MIDFDFNVLLYFGFFESSMNCLSPNRFFIEPSSETNLDNASSITFNAPLGLPRCVFTSFLKKKREN